MIKFINKKHIAKNEETGKITIYYSVSDIFLGVVLFALVAFFINDYLSHSLGRQGSECISYPSVLDMENIDKK